MVENPNALVEGFRDASALAGAPCGAVTHEAQPAPHSPHTLPLAKCAIYVFSLSASYGWGCPAGSHRVLKVGIAGPNSNARFQSQHYNPGSAGSTLAGALVKHRVLWPYLGISGLSEEQVGRWIRLNTDRDNFYLGVEDSGSLRQLERYVRAHLGPVFEGG